MNQLRGTTQSRLPLDKEFRRKLKDITEDQFEKPAKDMREKLDRVYKEVAEFKASVMNIQEKNFEGEWIIKDPKVRKPSIFSCFFLKIILISPDLLTDN